LNGKAPLVTGSDVIVQVKKDEKGGKGAFLTRDVALPGQYVLLMPMSRFVGVSKRIEDPGDHAAAKALGRSIADGRFGVIVRHAALFARREAVAAEAEELYLQWQQATAHVQSVKAPAVLMQEQPVHRILARDYGARYAVETHLCPEQLHGEDASNASEDILHTQTELEALWQGSHLQRQLKEALSRKVPLPGGASLIIDEREALHTIDVNSGGNVQAPEGMSLALSQNLEAVPEIARQIRLRNLSGILLIDFIDMDTPEEEAAVAKALEEAFSNDRIKTVLHGFTSLGLMELTRKRTGSSLRELLTVPCGHCGGSGAQNLP
jgi:ribonuclease G